MSSTLPWWLGNAAALSAFVAGTGTLALLWGRKHRGDAEVWRSVETVATVIGAISLILLTFNVERLFAARYFDGFRQRYVGASVALINHADFVASHTCNTVFVKGPLSPLDFDDMVDDQKVVCDWSRKLRDAIQKIDFRELQPLDVGLLTPPPQKTRRWSVEIADYRQYAGYYTAFRDDAQNLKAQAEGNEFQLVLIALAPYLLGLALALQFAKVRYK